MNLSPQEIRDLKNAVRDAAELIAWKQESHNDYDRADLDAMHQYIIRLFALRAKLSAPGITAGLS
jgi:hypothetical protein